jgi:Tol biopolymer transport system component
MRAHARWPGIAMTLLALLAGACTTHDATGVDALLTRTNGPVKIEIDPRSATLAVSSTQRFTATVTVDGRTLDQAPVTWSTSDESVVTVTAAGLATGIHDGNAFVRAAFGPALDSVPVGVGPLILRNVIIYTTEAFGLPEIAIVHPDGSGRQRLTTDQSAYAAPVISPDGRRIAVASPGDGTWSIYLMNSDGSGKVKLVGRSGFDGSPAWSPDGTKLAFRSENDGPFGPFGRIYVISVDGTGLHQLSPDTPDYTFDDGPTWSPDGSRIAFSRNGTLEVINADGSGLTALGVGGGYPAWSPDGTRIAFQTEDQAADIYISNADGSNLVQVTTGPGEDQTPRWSPDGTRLVFGRAENGLIQLYLINVDGTGEVKLSATADNEGWPSWSPVP